MGCSLGWKISMRSDVSRRVLTISTSYKAIRLEQAYIAVRRARYGFHFGEKLISLRGNLGSDSFQSFVLVSNTLYLSSYLILVAAFNQLHQQGVDFLLLVIDNGYDQPGDAKVLRYKACDSINFLGEKKNVEDYLLLANVFCLTSLYEGLPISLLEALSAGCIPICTAVGGIPDVIVDGVTGYLSEGGSVDAYCATLMRYLDNPNAIDKKILTKHFNDNYSNEKCASYYELLYRGFYKRNQKAVKSL